MHAFNLPLALVTTIAVGTASASAATPKTPPKWAQLEPGLETTVIDAPKKSSHSDSKFHIVRIDPKVRDFTLEMSSERGGGKPRAGSEWAKDRDLSVVVNAGMFEENGRATHLMRNTTHVNSGVITKDKAFFVFGRRGMAKSKYNVRLKAKIIDRTCTDLDKVLRKYAVVIQGIRMVSCRQENRWSKQAKKWSMVVVAEDDGGRILFIHTRSPYRVNTFVDMLLGLPLGIQKMMYLEGGPEATFVVNTLPAGIVRVGSYETDFWENNDNHKEWALPNIIGVKRLAESKTR